MPSYIYKRKLFLPLRILTIAAILLTIVLLIINPSRIQVRERNSLRRTDIQVILQKIRNFEKDYKKLPGNISELPTGQEFQIRSGQGGADICHDLVPKYLSFLPSDPVYKLREITNCDNYNSGYLLTYGSKEDATSQTITIRAFFADMIAEPPDTSPFIVSN
jgi:hypothetical protein